MDRTEPLEFEMTAARSPARRTSASASCAWDGSVPDADRKVVRAPPFGHLLDRRRVGDAEPFQHIAQITAGG